MSTTAALIMPIATTRTTDRALARAVDLALCAAVGVAAIAALGTSGIMVALLATYLYEALMIANRGATLGKQWRRLRVVSTVTGEAPPIHKAGTRILVVLVTAGIVHLLVPFGPMVAVFLWGSAVAAADRRGVVDRVADTVVVDA